MSAPGHSGWHHFNDCCLRVLAETEMLPVNDLVDVEEALEQEEDQGVALEPFNLAKEREEGHFDENGHYVEHKEEDDPTMKDAWLTSEDGAHADRLPPEI